MCCNVISMYNELTGTCPCTKSNIQMGDTIAPYNKKK